MRLSDVQDSSQPIKLSDVAPAQKSKAVQMFSQNDSLRNLLAQDAASNPIIAQTPQQQDRGAAMTEAAASGLFGITPSHPELQKKYPVTSFATNVVAGSAPYLAPGGTLAKFTVIPAAHEIIRQATDQSEENKNLNIFQRAGKVATAGGLGWVTGRIFQSADLMKNIISRVGAKAAAGGATSAVNSVAQDIESGKEPDLHAAILSAATNAATIGLLGAAVEVPQLRGAIVQEASTIAGRPLNVEQAKKFLTTGKLFDEKGRLVSVTAPINPESLSPTLQGAVAETKRQSVMNGAGEKAKDLGVSKQIILGVMRDRNVAQRLSTLDEQIYQKIKTATGRDPVFDWRTGLDYQMDYSKMNPIVAGQLKTLLTFRKAIASGADPVDVLFSHEVAKQMKVKEYISEVLKQETRNTKQMYADQIATAEKPTIQPTEFFSQGRIESVGPKESISTLKAPNNESVMAYMPYLNQALESLKENPNEQRQIPTGTQMNNMHRDALLKEIKYKVETGSTEDNIISSLKEKLTTSDSNPSHDVSVLSSHQGKEDAPDTMIYDWRNLRTISINDYVRDLKQLNLQRESAGLPEIDPVKDITVHRTIVKGQSPGVAKQVRETIIREYKRAGVTRLSQLPPAEETPTLDQATQAAGQQAVVNLAAPEAPPLRLSQVAPTIKLSEAHSAPINEEITVGNHHIEIPKVEQVHEEKRQSESTVARDVVENRHSVQSLSALTQSLAQSLGRSPTQKEVSIASGLTQQEIRDILSIRVVADNPQFSDDDGEWQTIKKTKNEIPLELTVASDILKDLYEGISGVPYEQAMEELLAEQTKKSLGKTKAKDVFKKTDPFKVTNAQKENNERAINLDKMSKALSEHRAFLGEKYLAELKDAVKDMSSEAKKIINAATKHLKPNSDPGEILFSIHDIGKEIESSTEDATPIALSEQERKGGATFNLIEPTKVHTNIGMIEISGEQNWNKHDDGFSFQGNDQTIIVPKSEFLRIAREGLIDADWERYQQDGADAEIKFDEKFESDDKPWTRGESGQLRIPVKIKILKYTELERDAPTPLVLQFMRNLPFVANLRKHFKTTQTIEREKDAERPFFKVSDEVHEGLWSSKVFEDSVRSLAMTDLQPVLDDTLKHVQEQMTRQGSKDSKKKEVYQKQLDMYAELMAEAAEQIMVRSKDPNNFGFSRLGYGPHESQSEADAYVKSVQRWYKQFNIPVHDQMQEGNAATPGTLRHSRTPIFWHLLTHQNVMFNDRLQQAILFYKAQIEMPLLEEQIKNGIYSNADIWKSIQDGYTKHGFAPKGAQANTNPSFKRGGLSSVSRPEGTIRTLQEHMQRGETEGWIPIGDFFNNNFDYMVEAMRGIKQAQLLKQMGSVRMPKIEYESPEFVEANAKAPSPHIFHWVEHATNANIIEEAKRMSKLLGREVHPMKVLQEGGWIEGNAQDGLDKWYRGSFQPPFLYRTLYNEARTLWRNKADFESLGLIARMTQKLKFFLLSVPTDSAAQYMGNVFMERPAWKVVPYMIGLAPRTLFYAAKGLVSGVQIAKGTYNYQVGKTPNEIAWNRLFIEEGMTATAGYKAFLSNAIDKEDRGIFPQRQDKADDLNDYFMSVLGMNQAVMGEMIAEDVLRASIAIATEEVTKGKSVPEAVKFTVHYMNTAIYNLHREMWQGSTGVHLRNWTTSRNFAATPFRIMSLMARGFGMKPAKFRTADGGRKEGLNTFTGADIPERFVPEIGWKFASMFTQLFFISLLVKMTIQAALSGMRGEPKNMFENPRGAEGMIDLGITDINGRELYLDFGLFKMVNSIGDIASTVIDPAVQSVTGNEDIHTGKGALKFVQGKLGVAFTLMEAAGIKDNFDGTPVYDVNDGISWDNAKRLTEKLSTLAPVNSFVGSGSVKVPYSRDPLVDLTLKALTMSGFTVKPVDSNELQGMKKTAASEIFKQREATSNIFTTDQAREALQQGDISKETFKNKMKASANPIEYFKRSHRKVLLDARRRNQAQD